MHKHVYKYRVPEHSSETVYRYESEWSDWFLEYLVEEVARDYHDQHEGWQHNWPLVFLITTDNGGVVGQFTVDRDVELGFTCRHEVLLR